jgi:hypothetical protein
MDKHIIYGLMVHTIVGKLLITKRMMIMQFINVKIIDTMAVLKIMHLMERVQF